MKCAVIAIAASHLLDASLGPGPAFLGFGGGDQPRAAKHREVGRMLVRVGSRERVHRRRDRVVLHDGLDHVEKDALAVPARPVDEHQRVFARQPRQAISAPLLKEFDQVGVVAGCLVQELEPARTGFIERRHARSFS